MDCSVGPYSKDIQGPDHVCFGAGELEISFRRTVKVSDNQNASDMPPDLGAFPVYPVAWFGKVPNAMRQKGGVFIPMHKTEAMSIYFKAKHPFAILVYVGGVNAISGAPKEERIVETYARICELPYQDYLVAPQQKWLDGVSISPGLVRQLIAVPRESKYTINAQLPSATQGVSELVFEVVPSVGVVTRIVKPKAFKLAIKTLTGRTFKLSVSEDTSVGELKSRIQDAAGIPPDQQRLVYGAKASEGIQLNRGILVRYGIGEGSVVHLILNLRGGGFEATILPKFRMSLAPGGYIRQAIVKDEYPSDIWDLDRSVSLNVNIVNSTSYRRITSSSPPKVSLDAATYAERRLPYYKDDFSAEPAPRNDGKEWEALKSISQIDGSNETSPTISSVELDYVSPRKFSPFTELLAMAQAMKIESDLFDLSIARSPQEEEGARRLREALEQGSISRGQLVETTGQLVKTTGQSGTNCCLM